MNDKTTNTITSNMDELTLDTMALSLKQLEVELKIKNRIGEIKYWFLEEINDKMP